jgi:HSP90 family molecular chaperone
MMKMYASMGMDMGGSFPVAYTLVLNSSSPLITRLAEINDTDTDKAKLIASEIYRLALISQRHMTADELKAFLSDSFRILGML